MRVAIAGGGIAGLSLAIASAMRGLDACVFEQAPALQEVGAGLQISPNGWRVLEAFGVAQQLRPLCFEPPEIDLRLGRRGTRIWRIPMADTARARWRAPYVLVHRADLVRVLAARLEALAPNALQTNAPVTLAPGSAMIVHEKEVLADVIVGADGLHSTIRTSMFGEAPPHYTGNVAWRGLVSAQQLGADAPPPNVTIWAGNGRHVVTTRVRGGDVVNFVGMIETPDPGPEGWRIRGEAADVLPMFQGWAPPVLAAIKAAPELFRWALFHRAPLPRWSEGRTILVGDAAHPMLPSFAQGAVQSLEDAWTLAAMLSRLGNAEEAGRAFFKARIARTSKIQALSVQNARVFHRAGPLATPVYYGGMAAVARFAPGVLRNRLDWIYGADVVSEYPI